MAQRDRRVSELQDEAAELQHVVEALRAEVTSVRATCETQLTDARSSWLAQLRAVQAKADAAQRLEEQLQVLQASHAAEVAHLRQSLAQREEEAETALAACRAEANEELDRLDVLLQELRSEHHQLQSLKVSIQRESAEALADAERRVAIAQEAVDAERASRAKLSDDLRARDSVIADLQGTTRVLSNRISLKEEELRRSAHEVDEVSSRLLEAHEQIGVRDTTIGQLSARVRVLEAKSAVAVKFPAKDH
jgi:chromosome segregation ATPase